MTDDEQLIETIREEWAPEAPHPGAFQADIARRLRASRRRRVAAITLATAAVAAALLVNAPLATPPSPPAPTEVVLEVELQGSTTQLEELLPPEYAALSALFIEPLDTEGT